jgi:hypothetical protein
VAIQIGGNHCSAILSRRAGILTRYALFFIFSTIAESYAGSLDGNWKCDDGGIYTVTQNDDEVTWTGTGPGFANVFSGHIQGPIIVGSWHDSSSGGLQLRLVSPNHMVALNKTGALGVLTGRKSWPSLPLLLSISLEIGNAMMARHLIAKSKTGGFGGSDWRR